MKKIIFIILLALFPTTFFGSLSVNTYYLSLDEQKKNNVFTVINRSPEAKTYGVRFIDYNQQKDGSYTENKKSDKDTTYAGKFLINTPKQFTLLPGQSQKIRVQRKAMVNVKDGEYTAHILVAEKPDLKNTSYKEGKDTLRVSLQPVFSVSIPIVVRKGNLSSVTKIQKAKLALKDGHMTLSGTVSNTGTKSVRGHFVLSNGKKSFYKSADINVFLTAKSKNIKTDIIDEDAITKLTKLKNKELVLKFVDYKSNKTLDSTTVKF